jgi:hypothetical protein
MKMAHSAAAVGIRRNGNAAKYLRRWLLLANENAAGAASS